MSEKIIERVALNFTDLTGAKTGCVKLGSNKFWTGEVVQRADGLFDFRCRWGSTGTPGKDKGSKYGIGEAAALKILRSKTASKRKKGYTQLDTRTKDDEVAKAAAQGIDLTKGKKAPVAAPAVVQGRAFHPDVIDLLGIIYGSTARAVTSGLSSQAGATEDNPIGNLSDAQLDKGGRILDEIGLMLEKRFGHETQGNKGTEIPLRSGIPNTQILDLTNDYYSNVPRPIGLHQRGRANLHALVVSSFERLQKEREFMQLLRDAHLAKATFAAAAAQPKASGSKETVWYDGLGCEIESCALGSKEHRWVTEVFNRGQSKRNSNWFRNGRCMLHVARVWKFTRQGSDAAFQRYAKKVTAKPGATGNIWGYHGTKTANLLGIGTSGLLMPERLPRGIKTGAAFGSGIYTAPNWTATDTMTVGRHRTDGTNGALKSANYLGIRGSYYGSNNTASRAYMFLQELALGVPEVLTQASWDQKRPRGWPQKDWIYACAGGISTLTHDEVVTFSGDAQVFRYLMELEVR